MIKTNLKPKSTLITRMEQEWVVIGEPNSVKPTNFKLPYNKNKLIILNHFSDLPYDKKIIKNPFLITDTFDQDSSGEDSSGEDSSGEESLDDEESAFTTFQHQDLVKNTVDYWIGQSNDEKYKDTLNNGNYKDTSDDTSYNDANIETSDDNTNKDTSNKDNSFYQQFLEINDFGHYFVEDTIISEIIKNTKDLFIELKNEFLDKPLFYGVFLTFSTGYIIRNYIYKLLKV